MYPLATGFSGYMEIIQTSLLFQSQLQHDFIFITKRCRCVSFISLKIVLPTIKTLLKPTGQVLCLVKPQFEAGKEKVGKKGVVREHSVHEEVIHKVIDFADSVGFEVLHLEYSPIKGPEGNIEYLVHIRKAAQIPEQILELTEAAAEENLEQLTAQKNGLSFTDVWKGQIKGIVGQAHGSLDPTT